MVNKQSLTDQQNLIETLQNFAQAYEQISVVRMQRVRGSVLVTREFIAELSEIFGQVKTSYHNILASLVTRQKDRLRLNKLMGRPDEITLDKAVLERNGKTVNILISADSKLNGDIIKRSFQLFVNEVRDMRDADIVIVGKVGKEMFEGSMPDRKFQYFDIPETNVSIHDLQPLMAYILQYAKTNFFYGQFNNMVKQAPTMTNISGEVEEQSKSAEAHKGKARLVADGQTIEPGESAGRRYIFEPTVDKIIQFFNTEVFSSFVMQAFHESELARLASRITAMEQALSNIDKSRGTLRTEERKLRRRIAAKKQQDSLLGVSLWMK